MAIDCFGMKFLPDTSGVGIQAVIPSPRRGRGDLGRLRLLHLYEVRNDGYSIKIIEIHKLIGFN
jgi:hypothetical protein